MKLKYFFLISLLLYAPFADAEEEGGMKKQITRYHLNAAYEAVFISRASRAYNEIIPNLAKRIKHQLSVKYPDLQQDINRVVDDVSLKLVDKQTELDLHIAKGWAERFNIAELREITAFYASPVGSKLAKSNTELIAFSLDEARKWGAIIGREMVGQVQEKLKKQGFDL